MIFSDWPNQVFAEPNQIFKTFGQTDPKPNRTLDITILIYELKFQAKLYFVVFFHQFQKISAIERNFEQKKSRNLSWQQFFSVTKGSVQLS